jgi:hypothetical protein
VFDKKVGDVIRVEWDKNDDSVRIVIEITDQNFKNRVIYNKDFVDILTIRGKDAIILEEKER